MAQNMFSYVILQSVMKHALVILFSFLSLGVLAQKYNGFRLSANMGVSTPVKPFNSTVEDDFMKGHASSGIDVGFQGEVFLSKKWSTLLRFGYNLFEVNDEAIKRDAYPANPDNVELSHTPYQNLYISGGASFNQPLIKNKFDVQPYVLAGINLFKNAEKDYAVQNNAGEEVERFNSNAFVDPGLFFNPGVSFNYAVLSFLELRFYTEFSGSDHMIDLDISSIKNNTTVTETREVEYNLRSVNTGAALSLRF